jgi:serine/threonine-protein kinase ATR
MRLIERTRQNFFETTVRYTLPALVVECDKATLDLLAAIVKQPLGVLLVDHSHLVLAKVFMSPSKTDAALAFLVGVLQSLTRGHGDREVSAPSVITTCVIHFLVELVIELGSLDPTTVATAEAALSKAGRIQRGDATDLGTFLKPHMLGVISHMNDVMHDIQGKKTVDAKRKVIRSLGALAQRVGGMMASFSPQVSR